MMRSRTRNKLLVLSILTLTTVASVAAPAFGAEDRPALRVRKWRFVNGVLAVQFGNHADRRVHLIDVRTDPQSGKWHEVSKDVEAGETLWIEVHTEKEPLFIDVHTTDGTTRQELGIELEDDRRR